MKKLFLVIGVVALCVFSTIHQNVLAAEAKQYRSSSVNNFSISYPISWDIKEMGNAVIFLSPADTDNDAFRENVNVYIEDLSKSPMSLEQYMNLTEVNGPKLMKGFKVLDKGPTVIGDQKAELTIYEGEVNKVFLKFRAYTMIKDKKAYTLTYTALPDTYNKYLADAENISQSINLN